MAADLEPVAGLALIDSPSIALPAKFPTIVSSGGSIGMIAAGSSIVTPIGGGPSPPSSNLWNAYRVTDSYPGGPGADPTGVRDSGPAIAYWLGQAAAAGGGIVEISPGDYRTRQGFTIGAKVDFIGAGKGNTRIRIDDSAGNIGDLFTCTAVRNSSVRQMVTSALSPRTSGYVFNVQGGDVTDPIFVPYNASEFTVEDVDMDSQFNGMVVQDAAGPNGTWKAYVNRCSWDNFSANGTGLWLNSKNGASHFVTNLYVTCQMIAGTTAIRISATGDATLTGCETWGVNNGLLIDPTASGSVVQAVKVIGGYYDQAIAECVRIAPGGLPQQATWIDFNGVWMGTGGKQGTNNTCSIVGGAGPSANQIQFTGCKFMNSTKWGLEVSNTANVAITGCQAGLNPAGDIRFAGLGASSQWMSLVGNQIYTPSVDGIRLEGGCTVPTAVGNSGKLNCVTDLTGGITKNIANNM